MADIDVEQKKGGNIWGWIIGILLIVLIVWAAMELLGDDEPEVTTDPEPISMIEPAPALQPAVDPLDAAAEGSWLLFTGNPA